MPQKKIIDIHKNVKVIILTMHGEKEFVTEAFKIGVKGYLIKDCAFEELVCAIKAVRSHGTYISSKIANIVINGFPCIENAENNDKNISSLTNRAREVVQAIADGKNTKEIALLLSVSTKTVETMRSDIMNKLNTHSIAQLTKFAIKTGLTTI